ncbi:MAG: bifunctional pyr operon transcriptional regulator/uracil phosphoribosyltransferase, partial [Candidatus Microthrix sp.]|nr:bifunctional pyr operon transcriptional regulator/uracil phosphoribosyltransferase [Candidatus Microthrix sp.]
MAERERRLARPYGGTFHPRVRVMDADDLDRARRRMAGEIIERNEGTGSLVLIGLQTGGIELARQLAVEVAALDTAASSEAVAAPPVGTLDVVMHRDDVG